ncbi:MAG TPA: transporter substrate-binding domain-containing protein [Syntrophales bacterium]|mgnify:CR=1 FL=1|nr:transporter substrate-binding domain-containing protein [Syntrophales bacterium]HQN76660.1 transporter substrate-binding domain-containing protein [Syntrophales bacterium]
MKERFAAFLALALCCLFPVQGVSAGREIVYGFDGDYPPHTFIRDGKPEGFDIDVLRAILENRDATVVYKPLQWAEVQEDLRRGTVHMTSGMAKTKEREALYLFPAPPLSDLRISLFSSDRGGVRFLSGLEGKRVATQKGSLYQKILEERGVTPVLYQTEADALQALVRGDADAFAGSEDTAFYNLREKGWTGVYPVSTPLRASTLHYAVRKGDTELLGILNEGLERIRKNGTLDRLYRQWFVTELTEEEIGRLRKEAEAAVRFAYAPYSGIQGGAAVLGFSGKAYRGCTVENALSSCTTGAVQAAVLNAAASGETRFRGVLSLLPGGGTAVPGAQERQILCEFGRETLVVLDDGQGGVRTVMVSELLPFSCRAE